MLYANTDEGSSAIWVCDGNGVVLETVGYPLNSRAPILAQINEHYGTSFTGWSDNEIYLRIGDTFPNWDAYEKIELPSNKIAVKEPWSTDVVLICGELSNNIFNVLSNGTTCLEVSENGIVLSVEGPSSDQGGYIIRILSQYNLEVTQVVQTIVDYQIGDEIPQWNKYVQYK